MQPIPLYFVWQYNDVDRAFWREHLEDWVPRRLIDAHTHVASPALRREPMTPEMRRQFWVSEVSEPIDAADAERCYGIVFPGRQVSCIAFGMPDLDWDIEASNAYVQRECAARGWHSLAMVRPQWTARTSRRRARRAGRPRREAVLFAHRPHAADARWAPGSQHLRLPAAPYSRSPRRAARLGDAPRAQGRRGWATPPTSARSANSAAATRTWSWSSPTSAAAIPRPTPGPDCCRWPTTRASTSTPRRSSTRPRIAWRWSTSAPSGCSTAPTTRSSTCAAGGNTAAPIYINRTNHDFHFNTDREPPEIEAAYTLFMYEDLLAMKQACRELGIDRRQIEAIFHDNAARLIGSVLARKKAAP